MGKRTETDLGWLRNHVKVVGEGEILASLVEFIHHSMAETIRKENKEREKSQGNIYHKQKIKKKIKPR